MIFLWFWARYGTNETKTKQFPRLINCHEKVDEQNRELVSLTF